MRVLILAPHPDDEINVAGSMILTLKRSGAEVFVAYSTNGDYDRTAELRVREAFKSLAILGVDQDHVIFLGYGDTFNGTGHPHVYYADEPTRSPAGYLETYAIGGFNDYAYARKREHSTYTRKNFFNDLEALIDELRAEVIFCVDLDFHADHRALSLTFEKVMASILRKYPYYRPEIYKKLAYATAFTAAQDFYSDNLLSTRRPTLELEAYDFDLIDKLNYVWLERVRFPMPKDCRKPLLHRNPIARAVMAHRSQRIQLNALGLINADEIFFERRTDSLTFNALVEASSGDASKACDFQMLDVEDINASPPRFANYYWAPTEGDRERRLSFSWATPQTVERIKVYGTLEGAIDKLKISLDNIMTLECAVERGGRPTILDLPHEMKILRAEFRVLEATANAGISEIELLPSRERVEHFIPPFVKLTCDGQFIYNYFLPASVSKMSLQLYRFRFDGAVKYFIAGGSIIERLDDRIEIKFDEPVIRVRAEGVGVVDEVTIRRVSSNYFWRLRLAQFIERQYVRWRRHFRR